MTPSSSALVVLVPAADPVVDGHRERLDTGRMLGVPAHVTILYPFLPPELLTEQVHTELGTVFGRHPAFDVTFSSVAWFGDDVAYLRPTPDDALRRLTAAVWERWPDHPPYSGEIADPTPHLTIGDLGRSPELEAAVDDILPALPVRARVDEVHLMIGGDQPGSWSVQRGYALADPTTDDRR